MTTNETLKYSNVKLSKKSMYYSNEFAEQSLYLNKGNIEVYNKAISRNFYLLFIEKGFITHAGKVDVLKPQDEVVELFGTEFLNTIELVVIFFIARL